MKHLSLVIKLIIKLIVNNIIIKYIWALKNLNMIVKITKSKKKPKGIYQIMNAFDQKYTVKDKNEA